jgi:hypothetical protein
MKRALSGPLAALVLCTGVVAPLLERADLGQGPVVESQHDPAGCAPAHDHTLCAQVGVNLPVTSGPELADRRPPIVTERIGDRGRRGISGTFASGHPTRAPPIT